MKVIISIVVAIAILITGISIFYPTVFKGLTSGTFGKADKFHKTQMTEKDIQLRSEFTSDTAQLKSMIQGLIYFSIFTQDLSYKIDSCVSKFQEHGICSQKGGCATVMVLQDYSDFIKNNNKTLGTTISMLTGFYLKDNADQSADVEKNLRDFGNYVSNLNEKDSILELSLKSMDNFLMTNKTIWKRKTELAQLKSIRDQLLIKGIQLSGMLQDKPLCSSLCSYALSSQPILSIQQQLGVALMQESRQTVGAIASQEQIGSIINSSQVMVGSAQSLSDIIQAQSVGSQAGNLGVYYDKPTLQFQVASSIILQNAVSAAVINAAQFNAVNATLVVGSQDQVGIIVLCSAQGLQVVQSSYSLQNAIQSQLLGSALSSSQLSSVLSSQQGIGAVAFSANFIGMVHELNGMGLGIDLIIE